ncbi:hypothetical protein [uncultured Brevundimonas sp.]|uniref:hypothetical protein n=1 Tax=uncultured Brevundimonas sp. TaxID=213418 RepID=UPI002600C4E0|nr:hypothetical protein [uncultured Brevundimonas sp.]
MADEEVKAKDPTKQTEPGNSGTGELRPDQNAATGPAQKPPSPVSGGEGAAGAGGPAGFGAGN